MTTLPKDAGIFKLMAQAGQINCGKIVRIFDKKKGAKERETQSGVIHRVDVNVNNLATLTHSMSESPLQFDLEKINLRATASDGAAYHFTLDGMDWILNLPPNDE